jgi:hypothetical protein
MGDSMKSFSKKAAALVLVFSSAAVAATLIGKEEVNKKVAAITAPYNNDKTSIQFAFTDLNVSETRALDFGLSLQVHKVGANNDLLLKADNIAYHYGNGWDPTVTARLSMKLDLVKAFGQDTLNNYGADLEEMVKDMTAEYTQKYGAAATVRATVEELKKDAQGNVESAKIRMAASINFKKLPAGINAEDVEFKNFAVRLSVNKSGIAGALKLTMNPLNKAFDKNDPGLKELIEKLLDEDQETYQSIGQIVEMANSMADSIVNADSSAGETEQ